MNDCEQLDHVLSIDGKVIGMGIQGRLWLWRVEGVNRAILLEANQLTSRVSRMCEFGQLSSLADLFNLQRNSMQLLTPRGNFMSIELQFLKKTLTDQFDFLSKHRMLTVNRTNLQRPWNRSVCA